MQGKNKKTMTAAERVHVGQVKKLDCVICGEPGPVDAHEPEQGMWWLSVGLCRACHTGSQGWHGNRDRWKNHKMTELKAINKTLAQLME